MPANIDPGDSVASAASGERGRREEPGPDRFDERGRGKTRGQRDDANASGMVTAAEAT